MSSAPTRHRFLVYAPDRTEPGTLQKRLSVRKDHLAAAEVNFSNGIVRVAGALLSPDSIQSPDAPKTMLGSVLIFEAESIDQVWEVLKNDVYYKQGVWDPEKMVVLPYVIATPFNI